MNCNRTLLHTRETYICTYALFETIERERERCAIMCNDAEDNKQPQRVHCASGDSARRESLTLARLLTSYTASQGKCEMVEANIICIEWYNFLLFFTHEHRPRSLKTNTLVCSYHHTYHTYPGVRPNRNFPTTIKNVHVHDMITHTHEICINHLRNRRCLRTNA